MRFHSAARSARCAAHPSHHLGAGAAADLSAQDGEGRDLHQRFEMRRDVEVRWQMVVRVHPDDYLGKVVKDAGIKPVE
jgi:hypothetical protein